MQWLCLSCFLIWLFWKFLKKSEKYSGLPQNLISPKPLKKPISYRSSCSDMNFCCLIDRFRNAYTWITIYLQSGTFWFWLLLTSWNTNIWDCKFSILGKNLFWSLFTTWVTFSGVWNYRVVSIFKNALILFSHLKKLVQRETFPVTSKAFSVRIKHKANCKGHHSLLFDCPY